MGLDTRLLINSKWHSDEIKDLIADLTGAMVTIHSTHSPEMYTLRVQSESTNQIIYVHTPNWTPIGWCQMLSVRNGIEPIELFTKIACRIGGFLQRRDDTEKYELITGLDWWEDGRAYEFRQFVLNGKAEDLK